MSSVRRGTASSSWHYQRVSIPRAMLLADAMSEMAPRADSILDVGCGDGMLLQEVARRLGARSIRGIDVKLQPNLPFEATQYDGRTMPFESASFDVVLISDVLHHAADAAATLGEALRVTRPTGAVIIKDHFLFGPLSYAILLTMDVVGNFAQGIDVNGKYLSPPQWVDLVHRCGGTIAELRWPLRVHSLPIRLVARSEYQFVARIVPRAG
jgi:SAM-dependent methyltransferase